MKTILKEVSMFFTLAKKVLCGKMFDDGWNQFLFWSSSSLIIWRRLEAHGVSKKGTSVRKNELLIAIFLVTGVTSFFYSSKGSSGEYKL